MQVYALVCTLVHAYIDLLGLVALLEVAQHHFHGDWVQQDHVPAPHNLIQQTAVVGHWGGHPLWTGCHGYTHTADQVDEMAATLPGLLQLLYRLHLS